MAISEALRITGLDLRDVEAGMALSTEAGWNQTRDDWRFFIEHGAGLGCREASGRLIASAAALPYDGPFGFIGMVLVTSEFRRRGIATALVDRCIAELRGQGLTPVLDATAAGAEVYRRQGFLPQFRFDRWEGTVSGASAMARDDEPEAAPLAELDAEVFGARRPGLLADFLGRDGTRIARAEAGDGFAMVRRGRRALQAGPVVAGSEAAALVLLQRLLVGVRGVVFIDVPSIWRGLASWFADQGFVVQRSFTRMAHGRTTAFGLPQRLFAVAGPEFG